MNFNDHSVLVGQHAFLGASNYHWINYNEQKLEARWTAAKAAARGTQLHEFAHSAIKLGLRQPRSNKSLPAYVNDAISYKMVSEQPLYYSENAFGTADSISFRKNILRIHDLKTGVTPASPHQLEVYAALFCLEYGVDPYEIEMELRIYQNNEVQIYEGDPHVIVGIMDKIVAFDNHIEAMKEEG
jgi:Protein of unknown function (DUF2800)